MHRRITLALALAALVAAAPARSQSITRPPDGDNQRSSVSQWIGLVKVSVDYNSPDVHGPAGEDRAGHIWGELVPYGLHDLGFNDCTSCPWRAGANENTVFTVSHDVLVDGKPLAAGAYGVHMLAGQDEWTVIFSRNSTSWGSFTYDPREDAVRITVKPQKNAYHEWLDYSFTDRKPAQATVAMQWENLAVPFTISVPNIHDLYVEQMSRELRGSHQFTWTNWEAAAQYCLTNKTHLKEGLAFAQKAVSGQFVGSENFKTLGTLAQLQLANGMKQEAKQTIAKAMNGVPPGVIETHMFARGLQIRGSNDLAMDVFLTNAKRHAKQWPVQLGLARGYATSGNKKKALEHARLALAQAPDEPNRKNVQALIKEWESTTAVK